MPKVHEIVEIHVQDVEWLIELWFRIHGGDPARRAEIDASTVLLAGALSARLTELNGGALKGEALNSRLAELHMQPSSAVG